ncbi:GNAT family N-acetyltransferase [Crocinitomix algicola]|uniref:GNAT family N-acetyltransferase n=1 Tax=Crocinitomix algicola TaxID=1740263 RepID=UPI00082CF50F|nr:GNAT family N-acetyltransferase [Crocinitomix algicola]
MEKHKKERVIKILTESFKDNKSTTLVAKQDKKKDKRLKKLIQYSIFYGESFGEVFLTEDKNACYIIIDTEKKKTTWRSIIWDVRLMFQCIGIKNVRKVMKREALIKSNHPKGSFIHLWYIGVIPTKQSLGIGTRLMKKIVKSAQAQNRKIYLETSTERNFKFYEQLGFKEELTLNQLGYSLKMYSLK